MEAPPTNGSFRRATSLRRTTGSAFGTHPGWDPLGAATSGGEGGGDRGMAPGGPWSRKADAAPVASDAVTTGTATLKAVEMAEDVTATASARRY